MENQQANTAGSNEIIDPVFYSDVSGIIDFARPRDGALLSCIEGENLEQIQFRYKDAAILSYEDAAQRHEDRMKSDVVEINEDRFIYALEVLPPGGWKTIDGVESFFLTERLSGRICCIYARLEERFFTFDDVIPMSGEIIAERVKAFAESNPVAAPDQPMIN